MGTAQADIEDSRVCPHSGQVQREIEGTAGRSRQEEQVELAAADVLAAPVSSPLLTSRPLCE